MTKEQIEYKALQTFPVKHKTNKKGTGEYDPNLPRRKAYIQGAKDALSSIWKDAQGDALPEIDKEVISLISLYGGYKVIYAHRPNPEGWEGRNIETGEVTHHDPVLYGKGGWNTPDVAFWLDADLPPL